MEQFTVNTAFDGDVPGKLNPYCVYLCLIKIFSGFLEISDTTFSFFLHNGNLKDMECFNISVDYNFISICTHFSDCSSIHLPLEILLTSNESRVYFSDGGNVTDIVVAPPNQCVCDEASGSSSVPVWTIVVAVVPSLIVVIIISPAIVVITAFCYKKNKEK